MIPRKKRRLILIISILLVILMIFTAFVLVYINTDMFKSNKTLFMKYLGQNVENMEEMYTQVGQKNDYENSLEQNKYTVNTQINVNNTENLGTTEENTDNIINQLNIVSEGQVDIVNQYNYQHMNLYNGEESILGLEYIQASNTYGIRFSDLFKQFLLVDNNSLQDLFSKLGYSDEKISKIPNQMDLHQLSLSQLEISNEKKEELSNRYIEIIKDNLSDKNFSKTQNQTIEIDGKSVQTNSYSVTLTKEQLNNLYLALLEQLKNDEIILGKLYTIQTNIDQFNQLSQNTDSGAENSTESLRDSFTTGIDETISKINQNNIGQDETTITVYENMKNTVRTSIQTNEYEVNIDFLSTNGEKFIQYSEDNNSKDTTKNFALSENNGDLEINITTTEGEIENNYTIKQTKEVSGNSMTKTISARYEDSDNRVEAYVTQNYQTVTQFNDGITLDNQNSIKLNDLEQEELQSLMTTVTDNVDNKFAELQTEIDMQEIQQVLVNAQLLEEGQNIESTGVTETEKTRYNSQFEMLKGQSLDAERVLNAIKASQNYINNLEVVSNTELRIVLDRTKNNPDVVTTLQTFMEEHGRETYNIDVDYDENTGLVDALILTIVVDES